MPETSPMRLRAAPPVSSLTDEQLVARLRGGDPHAGEELVARHHEPMLRYLTRLAGSAHAAEELVQQTWLSALEHLDQFRPEAATSSGIGFKAWVFRIATNKAHDRWRSRGREKQAHAGLRLIRDEAAPESDVAPEAAEEHVKLRGAIEQLPEPQRQVVLLRYYSGLKFQEIAELLGCPLNTALGRMHKAAQKLRKLMDAPVAPTATDTEV